MGGLMARGRMINSKITRNKAINDLSDDTCRLAFTWLVTFADVEGRTNGDPALVRSLVFPRRTDVTVDQMAGYIREWHAAGLVTWYEAEGDMWIEFPGFDDNQRGLDRRKEQPSDIPEPPEYVPSTEPVRTEYVPGTAQQNRTENEQNSTEHGEYTGADAPQPTSFDGWLDEIRTAKNKSGVARRMFVALYPKHEPPDYGYIGKTAKGVGGWSRFAQLMWENSARPPVGDVLAYIIAAADRGNGNSYGRASPMAGFDAALEQFGKEG
jgi:hypothetical protein